MNQFSCHLSLSLSVALSSIYIESDCYCCCQRGRQANYLMIESKLKQNKTQKEYQFSSASQAQSFSLFAHLYCLFKLQPCRINLHLAITQSVSQSVCSAYQTIQWKWIHIVFLQVTRQFAECSLLLLITHTSADMDTTKKDVSGGAKLRSAKRPPVLMCITGIIIISGGSAKFAQQNTID